MTSPSAVPLDLSAQYAATNLSNYEVFMVGEALVGWLTAVVRLGHADPGSTLDYATDPSQLSLGTLVVRDFVAWTARQEHKVEGCEERLRDWAAAADLDGAAAALVGDLLDPAA